MAAEGGEGFEGRARQAGRARPEQGEGAQEQTRPGSWRGALFVARRFSASHHDGCGRRSLASWRLRGPRAQCVMGHGALFPAGPRAVALLLLLLLLYRLSRALTRTRTGVVRRRNTGRRWILPPLANTANTLTATANAAAACAMRMSDMGSVPTAAAAGLGRVAGTRGRNKVTMTIAARGARMTIPAPAC